MGASREIDIREKMTRLWLSAEPSVRAYVAAAVRAYADREDVVQQIALTIARRFDEYDDSRPFLAWTLWLAKSRIIDFYRSQRRQRMVLGEDLLDRLAERLVEKQSEHRPRQIALERCLEKLPRQSRSLLQLRYHDSLPIEQIATALQSTPGSVRVTLFRIRNALADCIRQQLAQEAFE